MIKVKKSNRGFSLMELSIAIFLLILVSSSAVAALRGNLRALGGAEISATAASAIRELHEYAFPLSIDEIDSMDGRSFSPVLGNGAPLPGAENMSLEVDIQAVDDFDPTLEVHPLESRTRMVNIICWSSGRNILEAKWLAAER
jgi:hypothetical protein